MVMSDILWTQQQAEQATGGKATGQWQAKGVSIDSRTLQPGDLFIVIKGEHFDGHKFVKKALEAGAVAAVVERRPEDVPDDTPLLIVENTFEALRNLAVASRGRIAGKIIAVTGSVGKTSVKEMLKHVLAEQGKTFASTGNLNNHYGVPLSLSRMPQDTDYGIFEMGMNHANEISPLSRLAQPDVAIISTVEAVHLEFFDSVEAIADAKAEIFDGLGKGTAVLNADNAYFERLKQKATKVGAILSFGSSGNADFRLVSCEESKAGCAIHAIIGGEEITYHLGMSGRHQALNSLGVLACVQAAGGNVKRAARSLQGVVAQGGRGKVCQVTRSGVSFTLIDDSYNASPASVRAAIDSLAVKKGRKVAVLGDMFELGNTAPEIHRTLAQKLVENNIDLVFTAGDLMKYLYDSLPEPMQGAHCNDIAALEGIVAQRVVQGDVVLVKGSHGMRMDKIVTYLLQEEKQVDVI